MNRISIVLFGFPVSIRGELSESECLRVLDGAAKISKRAPLLRVEIVKTLAQVELRYRKRKLLRGGGFAMDFPQRTLYFPANLLRPTRLKNLGTQNLFARTIVFALSLLAEHAHPRRVVSACVPKRTLLYLHASAVATPKGALVFLGRSTFGKTTISQELLKRFPKLEDDQALVLVAAGVRTATPQLVYFGANSRGALAVYPVSGLFWLEKSSRFKIEKMSMAEAATCLLHPTFNWERPAAIANRLKLLQALLKAVPCVRLSFRKESGPLIRLLKQHRYL